MHRLLRHSLPVAVAGVVLVAVALAPTSVVAAPASETFDTPGAHDFVVPDGVRALTVNAMGGAGGSGGVAPVVVGGLGGRTTATIEVTPGETLQVVVGGAGGGYSGGGPGTAGVNGGGAGQMGSGGGGGASDVRRGGTGLADRVVVAGGGGGSGQEGCGVGAGGAGGGDAATAGGTTADAGGGDAGTADAPGDGGIGDRSPDEDGEDGSAGAGGAGGTADGYGAGGGGAGWFGGGGGGGGGYSGGGGGGSGHAASGATSISYGNGVRSGDGIVTLTWEAPEPTTTTTTSTTTTTTTTTTTAVPTGPTAAYESGSPELTTTAGRELVIDSRGWLAGTTVTVTMHSTPTLLGEAIAGSDGAFTAGFRVPASAPAGNHRVELTGIGADGSPAVVNLGLVVTASSSTPAALSFAC